MRRFVLSRRINLLGNVTLERCLTIILIVLAIALRLIPGPRAIDDAFITFRYARNIVHGVGFVYNAGEPVLGTTTPLYTLWMATLALISGSDNFPLFALVTNALADAASTYLLYHLGRRLSNSPLVGWAVALLWAVSPMSVTFAIGGMETSVYILLMLATFAAHIERRPYLTAALAAFSLLTRPDAAMIVVLIFVQLSWETLRSRPATLHTLRTTLYVVGRWVLVLALIIAPWAIFATVYFGSPLSQSVFAKSIAYRLNPEEGLVRLLQHFSVPFFESDVFDLAGLIRLTLYLALYMIAALAAFRREPRSLPFFAYPLLYAAAFAIANPLIFRWYLAPPTPAYMLGILFGVYQVAGRMSQVAGQSRFSFLVPDLALGFVAAFYVVLSVNAWTLRPDHGPERPAPQMAYIQLELYYHQVAADIKPHMGQDTVIAAGDIGALGYDTDARILDTLGLISPQTLRYYPLDPKLYVIPYAMSPQLILDQKPDWLVAPEVYLRQGVLPNAQFKAQYQLFETIPTDIYGSNGLLVFRRK